MHGFECSAFNSPNGPMRVCCYDSHFKMWKWGRDSNVPKVTKLLSSGAETGTEPSDSRVHVFSWTESQHMLTSGLAQAPPTVAKFPSFPEALLDQWESSQLHTHHLTS